MNETEKVLIDTGNANDRYGTHFCDVFADFRRREQRRRLELPETQKLSAALSKMRKRLKEVRECSHNFVPNEAWW